MSPAARSDVDVLNRHRAIWAVRPELRGVYREWFGRLLSEVEGLVPAVEVGSGPGFFKEYAPHLIALDVLASPWVDVACDAGALPLRSESAGALLMVDTLHHLASPLDFMDEALRVLRPGGRLAVVEPWVTPLSFLLYRYLHHEECRLGIHVAQPFQGASKNALGGNAAIPRAVLRHLRRRCHPLRLVCAETFVGLPYLATLGFSRARRVPDTVMQLAKAAERLTGPFRKLAASRILAVWEKGTHGPSASA